MSVSWSGWTYLVVCPAFHTDMQLSMTEKKKLCNELCIDEVAISTYSAFVKLRYLLHGRKSWRGSLSLGYCPYINHTTNHRKEAVAFACGASFAAVKMPVRNSGIAEVEELYRVSQKTSDSKSS